MSPSPRNPSLYARVKEDANAKFLAPTSIYKSAWIVREYKRRGGTYYSPTDKTGKEGEQQGLRRWFLEKWVDLNRPGQKCGRKSSLSSTTEKYPLCRPSVRVTADTPRTVAELTPRQIARAKKEKERVQEKGRVTFVKARTP